MPFLELYFNHKRVSLEEMHEKTMSKKIVCMTSLNPISRVYSFQRRQCIWIQTQRNYAKNIWIIHPKAWHLGTFATGPKRTFGYGSYFSMKITRLKTFLEKKVFISSSSLTVCFVYLKHIYIKHIFYNIFFFTFQKIRISYKEKKTAGLPADRLEKKLAAFESFKKESLQRKKAVKERTANPKEFTDWLYKQSNIIISLINV